MLSMHSEETLVRQALDAGARGYILKNASTSIWPRRQAGGRRRDGDRSGAGEAGAARRAQPPDAARARGAAADLRRAVEQPEIAAKLELSVNTVAVHRANIMNTLGVHKTAELVVYALQHGLVNPL